VRIEKRNSRHRFGERILYCCYRAHGVIVFSVTEDIKAPVDQYQRRSRTVIIVGGGRVGCHTAEQLIEHKYMVTVIDRDAEQCRELATQPVGQIIEGDGTDSEIL
jgi:glutamyl-tRNA reductase